MGYRCSLVRSLPAASAILVVTACATEAPTEAFLESPVFVSTPTVAKQADALVHSIGVNVHLNYFQTPYGTGFSTIIKPKLQALGVRHLRENGVVSSNDAWMNTVYGRARELGQLGMKFNFVMRPGEGGSYTNVDHFNRLMNWVAPFVENFEGLNEHDLTGRANWATEVRTFQQALWSKVKNDPRTVNMPVFGPSMGRPGNAALVGDISAYMNYSAIHPYPGGGVPTASLAYHRQYLQPLSKSRGFVATESGYHTALGWDGSHPGVTESAQGRYVPRLTLEFFDAGIPRTYMYELIDQGTSTTHREDHFGLLRNDGSEKPAYRALANMIAILKDQGPNFTPGSLAFSLSGDTIGVKRVLLQKRDGRFYLALWSTGSSYDLTAKADLPLVTRGVTVQFDAPVTKVQQFLPNLGIAPFSTTTNTTAVTAVVDDRLLLIEITR
ncbi:MAG TPA: hypothetical protein VG817_03610 [Gemmatimonadales bacterium]|nr:hypothetical protein [Gemmatimonadales bacterium]